MGTGPEEISEYTERIRDRDRQRFELELEGEQLASRGLFSGRADKAVIDLAGESPREI